MPYADWRRERMEWIGPEVLEREKIEGGGGKYRKKSGGKGKT